MKDETKKEIIDVAAFIEEQKRHFAAEKDSILNAEFPATSAVSTPGFDVEDYQREIGTSYVNPRPKMRPKTPDNAFEGGGLFAKLGAHEQKTRQLQDQRKREYNDILRLGGGGGGAGGGAGGGLTAGKNATDNQKIERRRGSDDDDGAKAGRERRPRVPENEDYRNNNNDDNDNNNDDDNNNNQNNKNNNINRAKNHGGHYASKKGRREDPHDEEYDDNDGGDDDDDDDENARLKRWEKEAWREARNIVNESRKRLEERRARPVKEDRLWEEEASNLRRERASLRSQSAPDGFQPKAGDDDRRHGGGGGGGRGGGARGGAMQILPLIGERGIKSAESKRKEEYRKDLERQMREQKILRGRKEDINDGSENFKAKLPPSWFGGAKDDGGSNHSSKKQTSPRSQRDSSAQWQPRSSQRQQPQQQHQPERQQSRRSPENNTPPQYPPRQTFQQPASHYQPPPGYALVPAYPNHPPHPPPPPTMHYSQYSPQLQPTPTQWLQQANYVSPYSLSQMPVPPLNGLNGFLPSPEILQTQRQSPIEAALQRKGLGVNPKPSNDGNPATRQLGNSDQYRQMLEEQIRLKEFEKRRSRDEDAARDLRVEKERQDWNPWGKGGAGAPIKDAGGKLVAELGRMKGKSLEKETWDDKIANLERDRPEQRQEQRQERTSPDVNVSPREKDGFGRGGNGIFGTPKSNEEKEKIASYQEFLRLQIEEKRREEKEKKDKKLEEEKEELRKIEEQRKRMEQEFAEEQKKEKAKEEEKRKRNEEIKLQMEERLKEEKKRKKEEHEKKRAEGAEKREEEMKERMAERTRAQAQGGGLREEIPQQQQRRTDSPPIPTLFRKAGLAAEAAAKMQRLGQEQQRQERAESPPVPTVKKKIESEKTPSPRDHLEQGRKADAAPAPAPLPPDAPMRLMTQLSLLSSLDESPSNGDLLRQLSSMRIQLKHEKDRVEYQLAKNQEHKNQRKKVPLTELMTVPAEERLDFIVSQVQGQKPIQVHRANSGKKNSQPRRSLLDASSNFVPVDVPLSEELFNNPDRIASKRDRGGEKNKRQSEATLPKRVDPEDGASPRLMSAHNRRRRERLNDMASQNENLDKIATSGRQSPPPESDRRRNSPSRRHVDGPNDAASNLKREKTQEGEILDEFLRQRRDES